MTRTCHAGWTRYCRGSPTDRLRHRPLVSACNRAERRRHEFAARLLAVLGRRVIVPWPESDERILLSTFAGGRTCRRLVKRNTLHARGADSGTTEWLGEAVTRRRWSHALAASRAPFDAHLAWGTRSRSTRPRERTDTGQRGRGRRAGGCRRGGVRRRTRSTVRRARRTVLSGSTQSDPTHGLGTFAGGLTGGLLVKRNTLHARGADSGTTEWLGEAVTRRRWSHALAASRAPFDARLAWGTRSRSTRPRERTDTGQRGRGRRAGGCRRGGVRRRTRSTVRRARRTVLSGSTQSVPTYAAAGR